MTSPPSRSTGRRNLRLSRIGSPWSALILAVGAWWAGASAPVTAATEAAAARWWSLQPLVRPAVPTPKTAGAESVHPIDAFIGQKLAERGWTPQPEASRPTLLRRLYFDLIGLPPTPEDIRAFERDSEDGAWLRRVNALLASPQYGERWARHWLDVVHFGETHGYDKDKPRPNAWPYRDYVIRALNEDRPYGRFVQEQVAGDALFPLTRDGIEALGFIAAGPWDFIGHAEVPETKYDGKVARHLDRDDMVANTLQTFNSLTVQCAQCHDHKFDPIPAEDYYRLHAVFAAVDRADKKYDRDPEVARQRAELDRRQTTRSNRQRALRELIAGRAGPDYARLVKDVDALEKSLNQAEAFGYHSQIEKSANTNKWVQVDLGEAVALQEVTLRPSHDDFNGIGAGFGFPVRFRVEASNDEEFGTGVWLIHEQTREPLANPKLAPQRFAVKHGPARFVRVTATELAPRQNDFIFALAELEAWAQSGTTNVARGKRVTSLDSIENGPRWRRANLTDGYYAGLDVGNSAELQRMKRERDALFAGVETADEAAELRQIRADLERTAAALKALPAPSVAYVATVHHGTGAFRGRGAEGGSPRPIHLLARGDVKKPGPPVSAGALRCLPECAEAWHLPEPHVEADRRAALARWLSSERNPLTWRSIVNRVWQYHFGRGLVETPNDFGRMGALPTHPELLDWLACEFRDHGQSLKDLHRLIVTSATYRQASDVPPTDAARAAAALDTDNRWLWRMNRRKLEAEAVRDAVLAVAGTLELSGGGPSFMDFVIDKPDHSPHYEYHLYDPEDVKTHRRSVYRFVVRSQPQPFFTTLDCADPSMQVGKRNESVSALQALALLNNDLMVVMAKHFAAKLARRGGTLAEQIARGHFEALGRPAGAEELRVLEELAEHYGLVHVCRLWFNLNEFSFVD